MPDRAPFQLTEDDVRRARLSSDDIGAWCIIEHECYHLFTSEQAARRAHDMMREGQRVR